MGTITALIITVVQYIILHRLITVLGVDQKTNIVDLLNQFEHSFIEPQHVYDVVIAPHNERSRNMYTENYIYNSSLNLSMFTIS